VPPRVRFGYAVLSLMFFLLAAVSLYGQLSARGDIWWTPMSMMVPLEGGSDRVQIYIHGDKLSTLLQAGQIRVVQGDRVTTLGVEDVGLRFNNWDHVRVIRLPLLLLYAAVCGVTACLFLLIVTGRLAYRGEGRITGGATQA
jgi:hypothetical protein